MMSNVSDDTSDEYLSTIPYPEIGQNYYVILGLNENATEKQIVLSYKRLSLKFHPDRNADDEKALKSYQLVTEAFQTLIDSTKRKLYDNEHLLNQAIVEGTVDSSVDSSNNPKGTFILNRFGTALNRFATPTIGAQELIEIAQTMSKGGNLLGDNLPPLDSRLVDLPFGWPTDSRVDRSTAAYYRITVDDKHISNGFFISCKSSNRGKFKFYLFDRDGNIRIQSNSDRGGLDPNASEVALFFTTFDTFSIQESVAPPVSTITSAANALSSMPNRLISSTRNRIRFLHNNPTSNDKIIDEHNAHTISTEALDKESNTSELSPVNVEVVDAVDVSSPSIFTRLNKFTVNKLALEAGQYLLLIHGDNFVGKSSVQTLICLSNNQSTEINDIIETDKLLCQSKLDIQNLKSEYLKAKLAYESCLKQIDDESQRVEALITTHNNVYKSFISNSVNLYIPSYTEESSLEATEAAHSSSNTPAAIFASFTAAAATTIFTATSAVTSALSSRGHEEVDDEAHGETSRGTDIPDTNTSEPASNESQAAPNAVNPISVAGGWLAKRFSVGISIAKQVLADSSSNNSASSDATADLSKASDVSAESPVVTVPADELIPSEIDLTPSSPSTNKSSTVQSVHLNQTYGATDDSEYNRVDGFEDTSILSQVSLDNTVAEEV